tara:strand:- start:5331 stop:5582 length:252 start_codon:yes stop_codon:yes gene_type:complete
MKYGIEISIDVTKLDKARFYKGAKGTYATFTTFVNVDEKDKYENNGFVTMKKNKDEEGQLPIVGNVKVFWNDNELDDSDSIPF